MTNVCIGYAREWLSTCERHPLVCFMLMVQVRRSSCSAVTPVLKRLSGDRPWPWNLEFWGPEIRSNGLLRISDFRCWEDRIVITRWMTWYSTIRHLEQLYILLHGDAQFDKQPRCSRKAQKRIDNNVLSACHTDGHRESFFSHWWSACLELMRPLFQIVYWRRYTGPWESIIAIDPRH